MKTKVARTLPAFMAVSVLFALRLGALAQFPPRGDDVTQSLGQFRVVVNPKFQPMMVSYPRYDNVTKRFTSPVLFDPNTLIGRSNPMLDSTAGDIGGVPVGTAGTIVGDGNMPVQPAGLGPPGTREVHTEVRSMDMTDMATSTTHVRAGINAPTQPISAGEVDSWSGPGGTPATDFPAQSFFDVFVEVDIPPAPPSTFPGVSGASALFNTVPLLVQNTNLTSFPPEVVYIHGMSTMVPIKFRTAGSSTDGTITWGAGEIFGLLALAGHGTFSNDMYKAEQELQNALSATPEPPVEPTYSSWAPGLTNASTAMVFPAKGDDVTTSLGTFTIVVNPVFQPLLAGGYAGWDPVSKRLTSPLLFDPATKIGRSAFVTEGSPGDRTNGVLVGTANTRISDTNLTLVPPGFEPPIGTREVHTEVRTLNMTPLGGGTTAVRAGTAATGSPISPGEVVSLSGNSGNQYWDFPAKSFFDVNVQVDLPNLGGVAVVTLVNTKPLVVQNRSLTKFPPQVIYIHGNSTAVPVAFMTTNPGKWNAGDIFGILMLAGHGIGYSQYDYSRFEQAMSHVPDMAVDSQYTSWAPGLRGPPKLAGPAILTGGMVQVSGYCTPGGRVYLEAATSLGSQADWATLTSIVADSINGQYTFFVQPPTNGMYFRTYTP